MFRDFLGKTIIIIEHLEERPTRWLIAEYIEAYQLARNEGIPLVITRVVDPVLKSLLDKESIPNTPVRARELGCPPPVIVLDLRARKPLEPWDANTASCIIIGGIMGDYPPKARGFLLVHDFPEATTRHLGPGQMSIHTATWATLMVRKGVRVEDLPVGSSPIISVESPYGILEIELPFYYPLGPDGKPKVPKRIRQLLKKGIMWDELMM